MMGDRDEVEALIGQFDDGGLSRGEAEAYVMRDVLGLDAEVVADQLDKSASTVETLRSRARRKLDAIEEAREQAAELRDD
jgi:DNA-directed RNA polymerase specialized sigma24 family protein